ncbi:MAG TPA: hypothetical protein VFT79_06820 [Solirubrobacterales bacterium]|nr:hypothetical protein [Solirubrobacterales bacterium]
MPKRVIRLALSLMVAVCLLAAPSAASAAPSPWWEVVTGSRPTNLWIPQNQVQEINAPITPFFLSVGGTPAGAFNFPPFFPESTPENVQLALESVYGAGNVEVTGGPGGVAPLIVTSKGADAGKIVPMVEIGPSGSVKLVQAGGSGRLTLSVINIGDAPVDGSSSPVTIVNELPEGVEAGGGIEAVAGGNGGAGPVDCKIEGGVKVVCSFEGELPPFEAIEVEVLARLTGEPPVAGAPGKVTISGGGAPSRTVFQEIKVSPEKTPFGIERFSSNVEEEGGGAATKAGRHPFQLTTTIQLNSGVMEAAANRRESSVEQPAQPRNLRFPLPAGLIGNATAAPTCDFATFINEAPPINECPPETAIGAVSALIVEEMNLGFARAAVPVFNLPPAIGEPARLGFTFSGVPVIVTTAVDPDNEYRIIASVSNTPQVAQFLSSTLTIWGAPGDPRHDNARGWNCIWTFEDLGPCERPSGLTEDAFLRQPVSCVTPLDFQAQAEPWNTPLGSLVEEAGVDQGTLSGCNQIPFSPSISATPSSKATEGSSGLAFELDMPNAGLLNKDAVAEGQAKKVEVTLPKGVTVNPSQAEGLGACSPADYARETASSPPGQGCPEAAKIGSVNVTTPLLEEEAKGSVYIASPYDNPFDSLLALYMVVKIPERGILIKQAGKVELDPKTGQLVSTFDDLPQVPFETFSLNFFGGDRAPLVMPPKCGTYDIVAKFTPWHASNPDSPLPSEVITKTSSFTVDRGTNGGPCPSGTPPFKPGFTAGTTNNAAGSYSPFTARLTRNDGEQEFSRFSLKLPKGVIGKLAGLQFCSEAGIAAARARTGPNGGQEEQQSPSCPAASEIGRTLVGAGVGSALSYAPGKIYLAGPFQGSKLSIVAITTAKVGPFDLGNVVIRQALKVDSETAEVSTDGAASDPIPHILQGIVVRARDIRVFVDRENFVLNPTSCERMTTGATVLGSGLDPESLADDQSVDVGVSFQAADCANLGFKPKLSLQLLGSTKRTGTPRLKAVLNARPGDANIGRAQVTLPRSAFLEQAHIRTVCTRVQFRAGGGNGEQCPKASIYGRAKATSPLLDERLSGPVYLRSSDNELPDLVAALHSSKVDINVVGRIDSVNGRLRNTFETVPDAPVTKFVLEMQGGNKGLIVNSTNICKGKPRAIAAFKGQNGRRHEFKPLVKAQCKGKKAKKGGRRK